MAVIKVIKVLSSSTIIWEDATRKAVTHGAKWLKKHSFSVYSKPKCFSKRQRSN